MKQTKHTPGLWEWKQSRGNNIYEYRVFTQHRVIAELDSEDATTPGDRIEAETIKANAHLIAAAPELLEALTAVYADIELQNVKGGSDELNLMVQMAIEKATVL